MDCQRRRGRRGRGHSYATLAMPNRICAIEQSPRQWCFTNSVTSFLILSSLIGVIYLMLDYHCHTCSPKCDMNNLTKNVEQIAKNLSLMKDGYYDLEMKISRFSQEIPKMEGQINILEALANTMVQKEFGWDPKSRLTLPDLDTLLEKAIYNEQKNMSKRCLKCSKCRPKPVMKPVTAITPKPIAVNQD